MGTKHPGSLGRSGREHWGEVWEASEVINRRVFAGETITLEDHPWTVLRNGRPEETFFTAYFTPIRDETGAVAGNFVISFETTEALKEKAERVWAEEELRKSEARLSGILRQLPVGVGLFDRKGKFLLRGGLLGGLWGTVMPSRDSGQAQRWRSYDAQSQLLRPDDYPGARALRGETVLPGTDFLHRADDERETWIRVSAAPFRNASGEIEGAVAILQDVDAEKRAEQRIRENEERFRQFAEHSSNVLWILNIDTRQFECLSPVFEGLWRRSRDSYQRRTLAADALIAAILPAPTRVACAVRIDVLLVIVR